MKNLFLQSFYTKTDLPKYWKKLEKLFSSKLHWISTTFYHKNTKTKDGKNVTLKGSNCK